MFANLRVSCYNGPYRATSCRGWKIWLSRAVVEKKEKTTSFSLKGRKWNFALLMTDARINQTSWQKVRGQRGGTRFSLDSLTVSWSFPFNGWETRLFDIVPNIEHNAKFRASINEDNVIPMHQSGLCTLFTWNRDEKQWGSTKFPPIIFVSEISYIRGKRNLTFELNTCEIKIKCKF